MSRGRNPSTVGRRNSNRSVELTGVLSTIATLLEAPRDRLGRLDISPGSAAWDAREVLRTMAIAFSVPGSIDTLDQCAKVARAAIARAEVRERMTIAQVNQFNREIQTAARCNGRPR